MKNSVSILSGMASATTGIPTAAASKSEQATAMAVVPKQSVINSETFHRLRRLTIDCAAYFHHFRATDPHLAGFGVGLRGRMGHPDNEFLFPRLAANLRTKKIRYRNNGEPLVWACSKIAT